VDDLNQTLQTLIAEACAHPRRSLERRRRLGEIHRLVMASGKLWKEHTPYYNDALQEMWEFCCQNPERYDPTVKNVITWLDDYLKKRLRNLRDAKQRQQRREFAPFSPDLGEMHDPVNALPARADVQPALDIWQRTLEWVNTDPDQQLCSTCFRNCSQINCQMLIRQRLPPEVPWSEIAAAFALSPAAAKDLPKVYHRRCLPLLRQFAAAQGYLELSDRSSRKKSR
jgi:hypothetical protein